MTLLFRLKLEHERPPVKLALAADNAPVKLALPADNAPVKLALEPFKDPSTTKFVSRVVVVEPTWKKRRPYAKTVPGLCCVCPV